MLEIGLRGAHEKRAAGFLYIVKRGPKSIWYVPLICNAAGIIAAIGEPNFWITSMWMVICGGWVLSIIAPMIGARVGRRAAKSGSGMA